MQLRPCPVNPSTQVQVKVCAGMSGTQVALGWQRVWLAQGSGRGWHTCPEPVKPSRQVQTVSSPAREQEALGAQLW